MIHGDSRTQRKTSPTPSSATNLSSTGRIAPGTDKQLVAPTVSNANRPTGAKSSGRPKLRWQLVGQRAADGSVEQFATVDDMTLRVTRSTHGWAATVEQNGKTTVLATDIGHTKAYYKVTHFYHWGAGATKS
jgi:hypothetical protein